ncbi:DUF6189 family protein [Paenibacillus sp. GCM10027628]|uniref:DUF6189 family protein n=1 Tax=Paenibacillus sp. GCM10027628 TaxID=3273413 RepID=UPI00363F8511
MALSLPFHTIPASAATVNNVVSFFGYTSKSTSTKLISVRATSSLRSTVDI